MAQVTTIEDTGEETDELQVILSRLIDHAARPLEEAEAYPAEVYLSEALYKLEAQHVFGKEWLYVCRADQVPNAGDWYAMDIAGQPIVVCRDLAGEVRAMSRVCAHRFADVLTGQGEGYGNAEGFRCPYHSWSYGLDGKLSGAPLMTRSSAFERRRDAICLEPYRIENWQGFLFVNLDLEAQALAPRLQELDLLLEPYRLDEWRVMDTIPWPENPVSWKLALDNGSECYHHLGAHLASVEPLWPAHLVDADTTDSEYFYYQRLNIPPEAAIATEDGFPIQPVVLPPLKTLTPYQRSHSLLVGIFPMMWLAPSPDIMFVAKWWPTGSKSHKFEIAICVHKDQLTNPDLESAVSETKAWGTQIQGEDSAMVNSIQRMLGSGSASCGGPLSHLERPLWQFQRYLANRLMGTSF